MREVVGFDLDGVICPDVEWDGDVSEEGIARLHALRAQIYPIFYPNGDFVIITGRPVADKDVTKWWLDKHQMGPLKVHHYENDKETWNTEKVIYHKSKWINYYSCMSKDYVMTCFVESDWLQVEELKKVSTIPIYHFGTQLNLYYEEMR